MQRTTTEKAVRLMMFLHPAGYSPGVNEKPLKRGSHVMSHGMMSRQTEPEQYLDVVDAVVTSQIVAKCNSKMPSSGMMSRTRFRSSSPLHGEVRTPLIRNATSLQRAHIMPILRQLWMLHQTGTRKRPQRIARKTPFAASKVWRKRRTRGRKEQQQPGGRNINLKEAC